MDRCKHVSKLRLAQNHSILNPQKWLCCVCGTTESVWACLSCSHVACGRYNEEHAIKHFHVSKHPVAIEVNEKYVFCYICDDYVLNDNVTGDIKLLRSTLEAIAKQKFDERTTRSGRRLRALSLDSGEPLKRQNHSSILKDKGYTALVHRRLVLLSKTFLAWKDDVLGDKETKQKPTLSKLQSKVSQHKRSTESSWIPENNPKGMATPHKRKADVNTEESPSAKKKWSTLTPGVTGLRNLGNTCYMNSILQVLGYLSVFRECFLDIGNSSLEKNIKSETKLTREFYRQTTVEAFKAISTPKSRTKIQRQPNFGLSGGSNKVVDPSKYKDPRLMRDNMPLYYEFHLLFRVMWSGKWAIVSPHGFLSSVWRLIPSFKGYSQQDAQEFLCEVLDKVHSELQYVLSPPLVKMGDSLCPVQDIIPGNFQGRLVSQVTCLKCTQKSNTFEPFCDLSLEFPERYQFSQSRTSLSEESCHITEMLTKFTEVEHLGEVYSCESCNRRRRHSKPTICTKATKRLLIRKPPKILRLHLKRFRWSGRNHREKINVHVDFSQDLNLRPFCYISANEDTDLTSEDFMYDLAAVVIHHGRGFGSGHYTAYCWNNVGGFWVHCNDARLELCTMDDIRSCQAYIMFYTKRTSNQHLTTDGGIQPKARRSRRITL
ncbi:ubiquitin carboxyl-terminal hydrolase 44-like [Anneissia japonica]|uniref:ubiquitin carboxyl-terminal hydrolase 44-like n=1 Tax=Anneissia japonica TaxID=1529436 RepID=UPI0014256011|nr:ubiquitin carboxyl-terminal hydrolase 44-like [Anneissia japonica]